MEKSREFIKAALIAIALPLFLLLVGVIMYSMTSVPTARLGLERARQREVDVKAELAKTPESKDASASAAPSASAPKTREEREAARKARDAARKAGLERNRRQLELKKESAQMGAVIAALQQNVAYQSARSAIAVLVILAALAAGAFGALGLGGTMVMTKRAMVSRDALVAAFSRWRKALPLLLIGQAGALVVAVAAACVYIAVSMVMDGVKGGRDARLTIGAVLFAIAFLGIGGLMVWRLAMSLRLVFSPEPGPIGGKALSRAAAPELWSFVDDIARRVGTATPDNIVTGIDGGFFVTSRELVPSVGGGTLTGRTLYLSLSQLAFLDRDETAAIVGHELGHFTGEDLEYSAKFTPIYAGAAQSLQAIVETGQHGDRVVQTMVIKPLLAVAEFFFFSFDSAVNHWSRVRELAADQVGMGISSARASASALIRTSINGSAIHEVLSAMAENPDEECGPVLEEMIAVAVEKGLGTPEDHLEDVQPHPTDTHPPTRQRVEAMGVSPGDAGLLALATRAPSYEGSVVAQLLPGAGELCRELAVDFRGMVRRQREEAIAVLEEIAAEVADDTPPFEMREKMHGLILLEIAVVAILLLCSLFAELGAGAQLFVWALILVIAWAIRHFYLRSRLQPALQFTSTGIQCPGLAAELPWSAVEDYELTENQMIGIEIFLKDSFEAPERRKSPIKCKYGKKKHKLSFTLFGLKKQERKHVGIERINEELVRRLQAVRARAALSELKGE